MWTVNILQLAKFLSSIVCLSNKIHKFYKNILFNQNHACLKKSLYKSIFNQN